MKKELCLIAWLCLTLSSCCTVFTSSKQTVTFQAPNGTRIYDASTNTKIAEVKQDNTVSVPVKKRREDKQLIARKEGYQSTPFLLETNFNANSLWNILFWPGFLVDLGTEKMFKWDNSIVQIEMEADTTSQSEPERPSQE
ncbi:hypothetical protein [uncultured Bacteroides sp.]|uniref:hypothetical protein n=1 Tax=uncultured Bacteroides sp. TaxID=162156 RepID=UPI0026046565|nr:hypothetical protein [uncultured Bacteroides sp.]